VILDEPTDALAILLLDDLESTTKSPTRTPESVKVGA
jgi:hypothetical protein